MTVDRSVAVTQANEALQRAEKGIATYLRDDWRGWNNQDGKAWKGLHRAKESLTQIARLVLDLAAENETLRKCDCIPGVVTSKSCHKCGRRGTISHTTFTDILKRLNAAEAALAAARADTEKLKEALGRIAGLSIVERQLGGYQRTTYGGLEDASRIARDVLALLAREGTQ